MWNGVPTLRILSRAICWYARLQLCEHLATSADPIRAKYWTYQRDILRKLAQP